MSVAAQFATKEHLPTDWQHYSVYAAKVVFEYHNDQGEGSDIRVDPAMGVRLLGEDILPSAALLGCGWAPDNTIWQRLREGGNMAWKGRYEMSTPGVMETCSQRQLAPLAPWPHGPPWLRMVPWLHAPGPWNLRSGVLHLAGCSPHTWCCRMGWAGE